MYSLDKKMQLAQNQIEIYCEKIREQLDIPYEYMNFVINGVSDSVKKMSLTQNALLSKNEYEINLKEETNNVVGD